MNFLKRADSLLARLETFILLGVLAVLVGLSFSQVLLRNLFQEGLLWADTLLRQLVLWAGFLGASLAVRDRRHLAIDFLSHVLSARARHHVMRLSGLAAGIISLFLATAAWDFMQFEREAETTLFAEWPTWWFQTILPYSFAVMGLRFILLALPGFSQKEDSGS